MPRLDLLEWQRATPESHDRLRDLDLGLKRQERAMLARLDQRSMVTVRELRNGVAVSTTSYVGSIRTGPLTVKIEPKLRGPPFSALLGYSVGLPVSLLPEHDVSLTESAFQDLIVSSLTAVVSRLLAGGMYRTYLTRENALENPRGRILFSHLARGPVTAARLPCRFDERHENVLPNRVLLAGLNLASRLAVNPDIRARVYRLRAMLGERVESVDLTSEAFRALKNGSSRLTRAYEPAFGLIRLLVAGSGVGLGGAAKRAELPGFLLDMNRLFQDALERFLHEWLEDATVMPQYRLRDVFRYAPGFNPRQRRSPMPRPDYVLRQHGRVVAIADAKYRDLWERSLPPSMLYQLSVYALSHADCRTAVILYATTAIAAREARISISDPVGGGTRARVVLRPVCLPFLADLVRRKRTAADDRLRHEYAEQLAFGLRA